MQHGLPLTLLARRPEEIRRLARNALDAEKAAFRRRGKVGASPAFDEVAADAVVGSYERVKGERNEVRAAAADANRWLAIGNVWGLAGLTTAGALVIRFGFEPMSSSVYGVVVAAAVGPIATTMLGLTRRSFASMRLSAATTEWLAALSASGFDTMGELSATRISMGAWRNRQAEAAAAASAARDARAAWHRVAGPKVHPREAPALIAQMTALRAAQIELLRALLVERTNPLTPTPFEVVWAVPAAAVEDEPTPRASRFTFWRS